MKQLTCEMCGSTDLIKKDGVFDKDKIALVMDHFTPNKDIKSAEHVKQVRDFAKANGIVNYFDVGQMGIEHALLPEKGLIVAGMFGPKSPLKIPVQVNKVLFLNLKNLLQLLLGPSGLRVFTSSIYLS